MRMTGLTYLSIIRFSDTDAGDFLHNQVSGDVLVLSDGESVFACYCEPRGRVLALMLISRVDEAYYVIMSSTLVQTVVNRLKIYVMRSKVSIEVLDDYSVSGLQPGETPETSPSSIPAIPLPDGSHWFLVTAKDGAVGADITLQERWKTSELQRGIIWLDVETSGQFLPQMLGLDQLGAVNFRKGCYPGQEIVARTHYLGKVKRHPRVLQINASICPEALDTIRILSAEQAFEAVVVDCANGKDNTTTLFVVTRMHPDLSAEQIEYQDQTIPLV